MLLVCSILVVSALLSIIPFASIAQNTIVQSSVTQPAAAIVTNQSSENRDAHLTRTISVSGTSTVKVLPDTVAISFSVESQNKTAKQAAQTNAVIVARVVESLKNVGVSESEIGTSNYSIYPIYEYREEQAKCYSLEDGKTYCPPPIGKQTLMGYKAINSITIQSSKLDKSGEWVDSAISAGANRVDYLSFSVSQQRQKEIDTQLISDAVADARRQANTALAPLGMNVTDVLSLNIGSYPIIYQKRGFENSGGASPVIPPTQIIPGMQDVTSSVQVTFEIGGFVQGNETQIQTAKSTSVVVSPNHNFNVTLDSNASTGYQWDIGTKTNGAIFSFIGSEYRPSESGLVGSGGKQTLTFHALSEGRSVIVLEYVRPWDKENPADVYVVYLSVG